MIDYAFYHCERVIRVVRGDASALADMDVSTHGFWRSFQAIIISVPALFFTWVTFGKELMAEGVVGDIASIIARQAIIDLVLWLLPVVVLALAFAPLGLSKNYPVLIIARNWLSAIVSYLVAAVGLLYVLAPTNAQTFFAFLFLATLMVSIWMFLRVTLAALPNNHGIAYAAIVIEVVAVFTLAEMLTGLFGLVPV
ncbi:MAG: hypothetical protein AAFY99_05055 [Pseudomonadota bacterium]